MPSVAKSTKGDASMKEKTGYEKFEAELKETVFAVIFLLVKDEDESVLASVADAVIELFQLISFPFLSVYLCQYLIVLVMERRGQDVAAHALPQSFSS